MLTGGNFFILQEEIICQNANVNYVGGVPILTHDLLLLIFRDLEKAYIDRT